jgi:hypothetical protein
VRLEAFTASNFNVTGGGTRGSPVDQGSLRPASTIRVTAIDGIPVPANSAGSFVLPDVTISKNTPVNVDIEATGVPSGTVVTLQVFSQTPTDITVVNMPTAGNAFWHPAVVHRDGYVYFPVRLLTRVRARELDAVSRANDATGAEQGVCSRTDSARP